MKRNFGKRILLSLMLCCIFLFCGKCRELYAQATDGAYMTDVQRLSLSASSDFVIEEGILKAYNGHASKVVIPDGVTEIATEVFYGNRQLQQVVFPDSLKIIGENAFYNTEIYELDFNQVEVIGAHAFDSCNSIKGLVFPESIRTIGAHAFEHCTSLRYIVFEDGIVSIGEKAFSSTHSVEMIKLAPSIQEMGEFAFAGAHFDPNGYVSVYVPREIGQIGASVFSLHPGRIEESLELYHYNVRFYGYTDCTAYEAVVDDDGDGIAFLFNEQENLLFVDFYNMENRDVNELFDYTRYLGVWDGDSNRNGEVTLLDANLALEWALGISEPEKERYISYVDYNENGEIDLADVTQVLRKALGIIV